MKAAEIREKSTDELLTLLKDTKDKIYRLRAQMTASKVDNPKLLTFLRKDVAVILTILRERGIGSENIFFKKDKTLGYHKSSAWEEENVQAR